MVEAKRKPWKHECLQKHSPWTRIVSLMVWGREAAGECLKEAIGQEDGLHDFYDFLQK
jgi:hypothetical protein